MRRERGFTLIEMLAAVFVLALFMGIAFAVLFPMVSYLSPAQAKINTQQNAVPLLYKLQREVRQSDYRAMFVWQSPSAIALPSTFTDITAFAVASAKTGTAGSACYPGGDFVTQAGSGQPLWQGFDVFMLQNSALKCVFEPITPQAQWPDSTQAATAISAALTVASPAVFGNAVLDIKVKADSTTFVTDFQIKAVSTVNGTSNATTYTADILTRN